MYSVNGHDIFIIIFVTFLSSLVLTPIAHKIAYHVKALDYPNKRRLNKKPMPTLGGLAIFCSFLIGYMLYAESSVQMLSILMGSFFLIIMGMIDDINPIRAKYQLIVQIFAASIIAFYGHITVDYLSILGMHFTFAPPFNYLITIILIVGIINAINLSDGLDGLSSGISAIYFVTIIIIAFLMQMQNSLDTTLCLIMLGSVLGFLVYNFPPAKIYVGDTGSNFLGFIIAVTSLLGYKTATFTSLLIPIIILATPIMDVGFSIIRRILKGQNPFNTPDKEHLHHQLLKLEFSTKSSLLIIYAIDILFAITSILYAIGDTTYAILIYVGLMIFFLFIVLKTDILFKKEPKESRILKLYKKYQEIINYLIVGVLTTVVSLGTYFICVHTFLDATNSVELQIANVISWIFAVIFAYVTNRIFVFKSKNKNYLKEITSFFTSRVLTLLMDMLVMFLFVTIFHGSDTIGKLISQVIVTIANYLFSKIFVFKK